MNRNYLQNEIKYQQKIQSKHFNEEKYQLSTTIPVINRKSGVKETKITCNKTENDLQQKNEMIYK